MNIYLPKAPGKDDTGRSAGSDVSCHTITVLTFFQMPVTIQNIDNLSLCCHKRKPLLNLLETPVNLFEAACGCCMQMAEFHSTPSDCFDKHQSELLGREGRKFRSIGHFEGSYAALRYTRMFFSWRVWLMHVMRLRMAGLKLWSASDRRTGGRAVPIKEQCSDTAYPWYVALFS